MLLAGAPLAAPQAQSQLGAICERRDNQLELQVRAVLGDDLRVEGDLSRWFPVWGAPGL